MLDVLKMVGVVAFVVFFFGFCVFIHELGHFLAAKWCGLHINAFSIGFKKAWGKTIDGIEYRVGWLPFGGYVDLPQVDATGSDVVDQHGNPLPPGSPVHRIITAIAGPLFNVLFGLALGCVIWVWGVPQDSPRMSTIEVESIIDGAPSMRAGLEVGDKIVKLNGERLFHTWGKFLEKFILTAGKTTLTVLRDGKEVDISFQAEINPSNGAIGKRLKSEEIASPWFSPVIPAVVYPKLGSSASKAGMRAGDKIVTINGKNVNGLSATLKEIDNLNIKKYDFTVLRDGESVKLQSFESIPTKNQKFLVGTVSSHLFYHPIFTNVSEESKLYQNGVRTGDEIIAVNGDYISNFEDFESVLQPSELPKIISLKLIRNDKPVTLEGFSIPAESDTRIEKNEIEYKKWVQILDVVEGKAAHKAGIKAGDRIISVNDKDLESGDSYIQAIKLSNGKSVKVTVLRNGKVESVNVTPELFMYQDIGFAFAQKSYPTPVTQLTDVVMNSYRSLKAVGTGVLYKMGLTEQKTTLGLRNFSGPVGISTMIGKIVSRGSYLQGLAFIVMITYSLGLLNLMPLPVLDGGHIVMALIQIVIRRPLPAKLVEPLMSACAILLISFMLYVTVYDVIRLKGESGPSDKTTLILSTQ